MNLKEWIEENAEREDLLSFVFGDPQDRDVWISEWSDQFSSYIENTRQEAQNIEADNNFHFERDTRSRE